jgi:TetR/AcrR family transcriptional regulator, acrAB operon repressor
MRRTKEEAAATRETLLQAALKVFSRKGFAAATLEDVAREAGVTRGAIYWHFGSKAELYAALTRAYSARSGEIVQAAAAEGGSLLEILERILVRLLVAVQIDASLRAVMELSLFQTERTAELAASRQQQLEGSRALADNIAAVMGQGIAAGELRADLDPAAAARAFLAFQNGAVYIWLADPTSFSLKDSAAALANIFIQGIAPRRD